MSRPRPTRQDTFSRRRTKKKVEVEEHREEETQMTAQQKYAKMLYKKNR